MSKQAILTLKTWKCKIGEHEALLLPPEADGPMRRAVANAYRAITHAEPDFIFSGWGDKPIEPERAAHENREPSEEYYRQWLARKAAPALLEALEEGLALLQDLESLGFVEEPHPKPIQEKMKAAIAQARGTHPDVARLLGNEEWV